ncbi:hypothetical protein BDQ12DRAFT_593556, partial [Crucibulum laeve]
AIILPEGVTSSLVKDVKLFFGMDDQYVEASIHHHWGDLLHRHPGTSKREQYTPS